MQGNPQLTEALEKIEELSDKNEKLKKRIKELEELLGEKFRTKKLFIISMSVIAVLGFNLISYYTTKVFLIHPVVAIPGLVVAVFFTAVMVWRMKKEKG